MFIVLESPMYPNKWSQEHPDDIRYVAIWDVFDGACTISEFLTGGVDEGMVELLSPLELVRRLREAADEVERLTIAGAETD